MEKPTKEQMMAEMLELQRQNRLLLEQMVLMNEKENQEGGGSFIEDQKEVKNEGIVEVAETNMAEVSVEESRLKNLGKKVEDFLVFVKELPRVVDDKIDCVCADGSRKNVKQKSKQEYAHEVYDEMLEPSSWFYGSLSCIFDPGIKIQQPLKSLNLQKFDQGLEFSSLNVKEVQFVKVCEKNCALKVFVKKFMRIWCFPCTYSLNPGTKSPSTPFRSLLTDEACEDLKLILKDKFVKIVKTLLVLVSILRAWKVAEWLIAWVDYQSKRREGVIVYEKWFAAIFIFVIVPGCCHNGC